MSPVPSAGRRGTGASPARRRLTLAVLLALVLTGCPPDEADRERATRQRQEFIRQQLEVEAFERDERDERRRLGLCVCRCACSLERIAQELRAAPEAR